mmetsp:Transcript_27763/g.33946  ORF Transcript_27763/g.33946 Transcript_27763/m.33946 type:complete len:143 (-) Transcript_27763:2553-2981(-)
MFSFYFKNYINIMFWKEENSVKGEGLRIQQVPHDYFSKAKGKTKPQVQVEKLADILLRSKSCAVLLGDTADDKACKYEDSSGLQAEGHIPQQYHFALQRLLQKKPCLNRFKQEQKKFVSLRNSWCSRRMIGTCQEGRSSESC